MTDHNNMEIELLLKLLDAFETEAHEQIDSMLSQLVRLEVCQDSEEQAQLIEGVFRELHNLKGSARAVNHTNVETLCHPMETILSGLKRGELALSAELFDLVLQVGSTVKELIGQDPDAPLSSQARELLGRMSQVTKSASGPLSPAESTMKTASGQSISAISILPDKTEKVDDSARKASRTRSETLRVSATKLDGIMQQAEEMLSIKAMARQQALELNNLQSTLEAWTKNWVKSSQNIKESAQQSLKAKEAAPDAFKWRKVAEVIDWNSEFIHGLQDRVNALARMSHQYSHSTSMSVDVLLEETKRLLMMPAGSLFEGFPLLCRDLAKELGKEIEFNVTGGEIELDKRILSELKDPLVHLLRNTIDHGLELPQERVQKGKPSRGLAQIKLSQLDNGQVELRVVDDGRGIDAERIRATALQKGMLTVEELNRLSHEETLHLIFRSAFSTRETITEISGRGIGMAIVEETINKLGGRIRIETEKDKGTTFIMTLPVTIATFRGVMVNVMDKIFVIPTISIDRVVRIRRTDIRPVEGSNTMLLGDRLIPVCRMQDVLQLPFQRSRSIDEQFLTIGILGSGDNRVGFIVDEVLEEQEVLVKNLDGALADIDNVSGVTILGSGKVVPILNVGDMLKFAGAQTLSRSEDGMGAISKNGSKRDEGATTNNTEMLAEHTEPKKVLVVDDTLTARILLRNILESAGFKVETANDGMEALAVLKQKSFDLVVADIEMPRMDGFALTREIRADHRTAEIPVVMVTALSSREDREKGVEAGVSAYFVKSNFDQSNLLELLGTLV